MTARRLPRLAVAALFLATAVTGPLLHAGNDHPGSGFVAPDHAATSFHHDHAACVQIQSSTARPAVPPAAPARHATAVPRPAPRTAEVGDLGWRARPSARSPPPAPAA